MKMNNIFVKILVCLLIILTLTNFIGSIDVDMNYSFAATEESEEEDDGFFSSIINGIVGMIFIGLKLAIISPFFAMNNIMDTVAGSAGTVKNQTHTRSNAF